MVDNPRALYCISEAQYSGVLTYGCSYEVTEVSDHHIRATLPSGRRRLFPRELFCEVRPPELLQWELDDEVPDSTCCYVEVRCNLGGESRWLAFATPLYLLRQLPHTGEPCWAQKHLAIVSEVSPESVETSLKWLLRQGLLVQHSLPF